MTFTIQQPGINGKVILLDKENLLALVEIEQDLYGIFSLIPKEDDYVFVNGIYMHKLIDAEDFYYTRIKLYEYIKKHSA